MACKRTQFIVFTAIALAAGAAVTFWIRGRIASHENLHVAVEAGAPPAAGPSTRAPDEGWAGSRACAGCHREIAEAYQSHPMAHSTAAITDAGVIEDYDEQTTFSQPASRVYRVERQGPQVFHHESLIDSGGKVVYDQSVEIHYALGSGKRGRTYLTNRDGIIYESPISWYTAAHRWDLSPGYAPRTHERFERRAIDECLNCHVGRVSFRRDAPDRYDEPAIIEAAIGCERCHGPGKEHVRFHASTDGGDRSGRDTIVNPARLEAHRRDDVCHQCHLSGRRIPHYGRAVYDFRPGQRLEDVVAVFTRGSALDKDIATRAVGQVEQMRESTCYGRSAGRLGCTSCHDPHSSPSAAARATWYDDRCLACHRDRGCALPSDEQQASPAGGSCIHCHMPRFLTKDIPHASQTDHRIPRRPGAVTPETPPGEFEIFDSPEQRLEPIELQRVLAIRKMERLERDLDAASVADLERTFRAVIQKYPDDVEVLNRLGMLAMSQHRLSEAERYWEAVLRLRPQHEEVLLRMGWVQHERGNRVEELNCLRRYTAFNPWRSQVRSLLAQALWNSGATEEALAEAARALELDAPNVPLRQWLAGCLRQIGRTTAAGEQEQLLKRINGR